MLKKNLNLWLPDYIRRSLFSCKYTEGPVHVIFSIVDHFEPYWNGASNSVAAKRVKSWHERFSIIAEKFKDSNGVPPKYTFFYPEEEYNKDCIDMISDICSQGCGDVEIHLHHDNDTPEGLRNKLVEFKTLLHEKHGLLRKNEKTGEIKYGFIHGNWALDNSRKDGRWCGVNNEITILEKTGCYADFTLPSAPSDTQTKKINSIYYAEDDPEKPKSHDTGIEVEVGKSPGNGLMLIQGPLALNWKKRKKGVFPKIENGDLSYGNSPTSERIDLWIKQNIHVKGRPEWVFVKVHTHGTQEKNSEMLLGGGLEKMYAYLEKNYNDGKEYILHYASTWEMYNIIKAVEAGKTGNPSDYRNFLFNVPNE